MFSLNEQENTCDNTGASDVCKSFCRGSFCNKGGLNDGNEPRPPIKCHKCLEIRDHMGERVPNQNQNDDNCYELVDDQYLDYCRNSSPQNIFDKLSHVTLVCDLKSKRRPNSMRHHSPN